MAEFERFQAAVAAATKANAVAAETLQAELLKLAEVTVALRHNLQSMPTPYAEGWTAYHDAVRRVNAAALAHEKAYDALVAAGWRRDTAW